MEYICIGKIINTHGIKGEVKIESYSDFDTERYRKGNALYIFEDGSYIVQKVASFRIHKGFPLVSFERLDNINFVERYKGCEIFIDRRDRKQLKQGEYYRTDLVNLNVVDESEKRIGKVVAVEETLGAQNNLRVELADGKQILIPYIPLIVKEVDLAEKKLRIHVIGGLL